MDRAVRPRRLAVRAPPRAPARGAGLEPWLGSPLAQRAIAALGRGEPVTLLVTADHEEVALHRAAALAEAGGTRP